jgi:hypothetical protein
MNRWLFELPNLLNILAHNTYQMQGDLEYFIVKGSYAFVAIVSIRADLFICFAANLIHWLVHSGTCFHSGSNNLMIISLLSCACETSLPFESTFPPEGGVGQTQAWMPTYVTILHIPQMIWVWRATVKWYVNREIPKNSEKNLSHCHFVHHKSHTDWPGREPAPPRWEAGDWRPESCHDTHGRTSIQSISLCWWQNAV